MSNRILLVEDEEHVQQVIKLNLEIEGYEVKVVGKGSDAIKVVREEKFDLIILDVMLPELDGYMVCENIRLYDKNLPILFLSAKGSTADRITGLKKGADDYLAKPFELEELILRVSRLLTRHNARQKQENNIPELFNFGNNWINFGNHEAKGVDGVFELTKKEILLMKLLIENSNQTVSREHILKVVWDYTVIPNTRTIDNFILNLRRHFEIDAKNPLHIKSIRGIGYMFTP